MTYMTVLQSETEKDDAVALLPTTVPSTWTGSAATACQSIRDEVLVGCAGLTAKMPAASASAQALDTVCGG